MGGDRARGGPVEELVFGTREPDAIEARVAQLCRDRLDGELAAILWRATSIEVVFGLELVDGRRIVVKAHQPRESRERLTAVHDVQAALFHAGFPCPEPMLGPVAAGRGLAVAERLVDDGEYRDTHDPTCRRLIAEALVAQIELAGRCGRPAALAGGWRMHDGGGLWPVEPHAPIFDFAATAAGAEWIDAIAARAKPLAAGPGTTGAPGAPVVGHSDWSGKHFRFAGERITVVYDWDSLTLADEPAIVGVAAVTFTTNFELPGVARAPSPDELRAFLDEYSAARGTALSRAERERIAASATFVAAYTARCEHCGVGGYDALADPGSFATALREHGLEYLVP